ncbi:TPA: hypothetical protein ACN335_003871 [Vibrio parahaemolyticus]|uniref:hypothetical protein n=1 Tax=Vibrio parahaemolyticus TaxID=670 RepID=UPI001F1AE177|nr:hypothetical protein [Vibrio parahaemolyticus]EGV1832341.1 hypothetical protein [Vibrio parahaemolyticus]EHW0649826.1 hypothetical protein [Vibrio parahaemolyticus]MCG0031015.1 hypothetical protein [Vibrio parahaemolyticus]
MPFSVIRKENPEQKISDYIDAVSRKLPLERFQHETAYVNAFLGAMEGTLKLNREKELEFSFIGTVVNDRGPKSAEKRFGADFSLVFTDGKVEKAILSQAKNAPVTKLTKREKERLNEQCKKMDRHSSEWVVFEMPERSGDIPTVSFLLDGNVKNIPIDEYITIYVLGCIHGDRREEFITSVTRSDLAGLELVLRSR